MYQNSHSFNKHLSKSQRIKAEAVVRDTILVHCSCFLDIDSKKKIYFRQKRRTKAFNLESF